MNRYLMETPMLDYSNAQIRQLIEKKGWKEMEELERLKSIYLFVRDEIQFGYNVDDGVPASRVLADGYGQCNTKGTLLFDGNFTIDKEAQKGAMTIRNAPRFHSWVKSVGS